MNKGTKLGLTALVIMLIAFHFTTKSEYAADIIREIPEESLESIRYKLGDEATDINIAKEYLRNKKFYDKTYDYGK